MELHILEYLKVILSWPTITLFLVLILKKEIKRVASSFERGVEAKIGNLQLTIPPIKISENESLNGSEKSGSVNLDAEFPRELTRVQMELLKEFYSRGAYDRLDVSKALLNDFVCLKKMSLFNWESEEKNNNKTTLIDFSVTSSGMEVANKL